MIKTHIVSLFTLTLCTTLAGCGAAREHDAGNGEAASNSASADALEGAPELGAVQMALTEAPEEGVATADDSLATPSTETDSGADPAAMLDEIQLPEGAQELRRMQRPIRALNQALRGFLRPIAKVVKHQKPDATLGKVQIWGPIAVDGTEYRFLARRGGALKHVAWRLDARVEGETTYVPVAVGEITLGELVRRGRGSIGLDLDALGSVDKNVKARGVILAGFKHKTLGSTVAYGLKDFTPDPDKHSPIDALMRGVKRDDGIRKVRLAFHGNWEPSATEAEELVLARGRHKPGVGGRADALVFGGDVPEGKLFFVSECWDREEQSKYRVVRSCDFDHTLLGACEVQKEVGDKDACDVSLKVEEIPSLDPNAADSDDEDPNADVDVPTAMPMFDEEQ